LTRIHGTEARPSNFAAASLDFPSSTILSLLINSGTLNPSVRIELAMS
jgi:hypothetical protein